MKAARGERGVLSFLSVASSYKLQAHTASYDDTDFHRAKRPLQLSDCRAARPRKAPVTAPGGPSRDSRSARPTTRRHRAQSPAVRGAKAHAAAASAAQPPRTTSRGPLARTRFATSPLPRLCAAAARGGLRRRVRGAAPAATRTPPTAAAPWRGRPRLRRPRARGARGGPAKSRRAPNRG